jgi:hypothetical protein
MGKLKTQSPTADDMKRIEQMKAKHVLRLDWHGRNEAGNKQSSHWNGNTYPDVMFNVVVK